MKFVYCCCSTAQLKLYFMPYHTSVFCDAPHELKVLTDSKSYLAVMLIYCITAMFVFTYTVTNNMRPIGRPFPSTRCI